MSHTPSNSSTAAHPATTSPSSPLVPAPAFMSAHPRSYGGPTRRATSNRVARDHATHPFPPGASEKAPSACTVCLGRHWHDVRNCRASRIANSSINTLVERFGNNLVLRANSLPVCSAYNLRHGCRDPTHTGSVHVCSGCGSKAHNAQECHLGKTA